VNQLFYGDNLDISRRYIKDESVDLVYLDPPFKSNQDYNVLFQEKNGSQAASQIKAFGDTWTWSQEDEGVFAQLITAGGRVADVMQAFRAFLGPCDMLAYLVMMAPRLQETRRVMKPSGSIYLHCDPTASHYLKLLMDAVFGPENFRSEIIWKRSYAHSDTKQGLAKHGRIHDVILFYTRSDDWFWNPVYSPYDAGYLGSEYRHRAPGGRAYKETDCTAAKPGGDVSYEWRVKRADGARWEADIDDGWKNPKEGVEYKGVRPYDGRFWAYSRANMETFAREGHLIYRSTGMPRIVQYADEMPGIPLQDIWTDIHPISAKSAERLGYPTQKPIALLERIILSSCPEGGVVFDPFCGCGTTITAAQTLGRVWIGIDITHLAITLMKARLKDTFGDSVQYAVVGEPVSMPDAIALAESDPYQFQWWALGLVGARPVEQKKGADKGVDGKIVFLGDRAGKFEMIILSVKAGRLTANHVRDLRGVVDREKAAIGVLVSMEKPTKPMQTEAATAGFFESQTWGRKYPKIQLLTVADLLSGRKIEMPPIKQVGATFKKALKASPRTRTRNKDLFSG
jgi:DNA modification methylase